MLQGPRTLALTTSWNRRARSGRPSAPPACACSPRRCRRWAQTWPARPHAPLHRQTGGAGFRHGCTARQLPPHTQCPAAVGALRQAGRRESAAALPVSSCGRYLSSCCWLALRTSWLMHRLLCAPYDRATVRQARRGGRQERVSPQQQGQARGPHRWPPAAVECAAAVQYLSPMLGSALPWRCSAAGSPAPARRAAPPP